MNDAKLVLTRHLKAPPHRVFEACTRPDLLAQWLGPRAFDLCDVDADARVGGRFWFRMRGTRGTYAAEGTYREVVAPSRIVLTWKWTEGPAGEEPDGTESLLTIDLQGDGDGTLLTLTHEGLLDTASADAHRGGWDEALDNLAATLSDGHAGRSAAITPEARTE